MATVVAVIAAPVLTYLNVGDGKGGLTTGDGAGLSAVAGDPVLWPDRVVHRDPEHARVLQARCVGAVLNNIVQISTLVLYALMPGEITVNLSGMTDPQPFVLGLGCMFGVVMQTADPGSVASLRQGPLCASSGVSTPGCASSATAVAIVAYVLVLQVGMMITYRIAASATAEGISAYFTHWQLLRLPYGVLGVTILTAIMPRLSRNAAAEDHKAVVDDMSLRHG